MSADYWRRRIRAWHRGKLVILWAWCGVLVAVLFFPAIVYEPRESIALLVLYTSALVAFVGLPFVVSCVTWIWLGGKQETAPESVPRDGAGTT